ncbi:Uncharacterized protein HZ326_16778 [Fusarium oxysporum f. sp. albedinis]|nr:Uncharacterized protein HZ326_16778 [Fusarium oxysporum f. sp. albedinis]
MRQETQLREVFIVISKGHTKVDAGVYLTICIVSTHSLSTIGHKYRPPSTAPGNERFHDISDLSTRDIIELARCILRAIWRTEEQKSQQMIL